MAELEGPPGGGVQREAPATSERPQEQLDLQVTSSPELAGASPELAGASPELAGASPELAGASPELAGASPELAGASDGRRLATGQASARSHSLARGDHGPR